jgi:hypothetical protein
MRSWGTWECPSLHCILLCYAALEPVRMQAVPFCLGLLVCGVPIVIVDIQLSSSIRLPCRRALIVLFPLANASLAEKTGNAELSVPILTTKLIALPSRHNPTVQSGSVVITIMLLTIIPAWNGICEPTLESICLGEDGNLRCLCARVEALAHGRGLLEWEAAQRRRGCLLDCPLVIIAACIRCTKLLPL